ncbi:MAG: hypothetical protein NTX42_07155 [Methanothrix sp.]|nr:hypothetical protein [Methanothrix sp.]
MRGRRPGCCKLLKGAFVAPPVFDPRTGIFTWVLCPTNANVRRVGGQSRLRPFGQSCGAVTDIRPAVEN